MKFAILKLYCFFLSHYCNMNFENEGCLLRISFFLVFNLGTVYFESI